MKTQYDEKTDAVIYGAATKDLVEHDWVRLAVAALDQAGVRWRSERERLEKELVADLDMVGA